MTNDEFIEKESDTNELVGVVLQELDSRRDALRPVKRRSASAWGTRPRRQGGQAVFVRETVALGAVGAVALGMLAAIAVGCPRMGMVHLLGCVRQIRPVEPRL